MATPKPKPIRTQAAVSSQLSLKPDKDPIEKKVYTADYPFNNSRGDADVILEAEKGTDVVQFYVHRAVLRIASAFFDDMFSLPQPASPVAEPTKSSVEYALPIVPVTERPEALDHLLRMCYPVPTIPLLTVPFLSPVLGAALKYEMTETVRVLKDTLVTLSQTSPLDVFAEACTHSLEDVAQRAAAAFCTVSTSQFFASSPCHPLSEYTPSMDNITASSYFHLLQHHTKCVANQSSSLVPPIFCSPAPTRIRSTSFDGKSALSQVPFDDPHHGNAVIRSSDDVNFHVDRSILGFASPLLSQLLEAQSGVDGPSDDNIAFDNPEESHTLAAFLQLCYPLPDPPMRTRSSIDERIRDACELFDAANRYKIARAQDYAKRACFAAANAFPLRLYFIASRYRWTEVAEQSALRAVYELTDSHVPEMDTVRASAYRRLLVYRQTCRNIILSKWYYPGSADGTVAKAKYWSQKPWLENTDEVGFWLALHTRARSQATGSKDTAAVNVDSILPSSVFLKCPEVKPSGSNVPAPSSSSGLFGAPQPGSFFNGSAPRSGTADKSPALSLSDLKAADLLRDRQRVIAEIAEELAKVRTRLQ